MSSKGSMISCDKNGEKQLEDMKSAQTFTLTLDFLQLIILARRSKILKYLMEKFKIPDNEWAQTMKINKSEMKDNIVEEESWIFSANCLHLAAKFHPKALHVLISKSSNKDALIGQTHVHGSITPLHVATFRIDALSTRYVKINFFRVKYVRITFLFSILLHHGAPVDCEDHRGYTPLFYASKAGWLNNILELIEYGADVNHSRKDPKTGTKGKKPLFRARHYDTVRLLLKHGADPCLRADVDTTGIHQLKYSYTN